VSPAVKLFSRDILKSMLVWTFLSTMLVFPWVVSAALVSGAWGTAGVVGNDSGQLFSPQHASDSTHNGHYFSTTGDDHHFAWGSATPATPSPITIKYDFRSQNDYPNLITDEQKTAAMAAFSAWSSATNGKVLFVQDTAAKFYNIINVGTGDLEAVAYGSGSGGVLGVGGGSFTHRNGRGTHAIEAAVAWLDMADSWDPSNPGGTYDYFTVVAQEIGHALGLGHALNPLNGPKNIMNGSYAGKLTVLSSVDIAHIQSIYGVLPAVPLPPAVWLLGSGLLLLFMIGRRQRLRPRIILAA